MKRTIPFLLCSMAMTAVAGLSANDMDVEGVTGYIQVTTVADRSGTLIQLQPADRRLPIVLVLQYGEKGKFLPEWTGEGTLYLSRGLVAVAGEDGAKWVAKFSNLPVPASLVKLAPNTYEIVGIARYGQSSPLSEKQLANLRSFGLCTPASGAPEARQGVTPQNLPAPGCGGVVCTSGGEGATSCSVGGGGCSVTCGTGWYACCNGNTNNCRCCKYD